ncbi:Hypothetical protein A7982_07330 [Minicystis rosea]|nr:Hypothetical protein A7982_07330 [Minicystis rosea]
MARRPSQQVKHGGCELRWRELGWGRHGRPLGRLTLGDGAVKARAPDASAAYVLDDRGAGDGEHEPARWLRRERASSRRAEGGED